MILSEKIMDRLLSGLKTEVIWSANSRSNNIDLNDGLDGSTLIPVIISLCFVCDTKIYLIRTFVFRLN